MPNGSDRVTTAAPMQKLETDKKVRSGSGIYTGMRSYRVYLEYTPYSMLRVRITQ
jgi:hypothetical protein